jgi:hypothetical protein
MVVTFAVVADLKLSVRVMYVDGSAAAVNASPELLRAFGASSGATLEVIATASALVWASSIVSSHFGGVIGVVVCGGAGVVSVAGSKQATT